MNFESHFGTSPGTDHPFDETAPGGWSRLRIGLTAGAIALVLALLWVLIHRGKPADLASGAQTPVISVVVPGRALVAGSINANGLLAARRELPVGSVGEGGAVAQVLVDAGQWVKKGQVLAVIDRSVQVEQQANQTAQIQASDADARLAQSNLDRAAKLVDRGFISKADIDRLTATRDAAAARVRISRAQLGETMARMRRLYIVAPDAGLLLERNVEPGQVVGPGTGNLFRIARGGEMELRARLSEVDLAQMKLGDTVTVSPVGVGTTFTGKVWQLSPVIDPQSRQGTARIALSYAPQLRPGGFAAATISKGAVMASVLPESAILSDAGGAYVYIVDGHNKAQRRAVKTGDVTAQGIEIREGLSGNERVVLRAGAFLNPGDTVRTVSGQAH